MSEHKYNIAGILMDTWENGEGMRDVIFFAGCNHKCPRCQNKVMQSTESGTLMTMEEIIKSLGDISLCTGLTLSGGDPFYSIEDLHSFIQELREIYPEVDIWVYTGYTYQELLKMNNPNVNYILDNINVLVDGKFNYKQSNYYNPDVPSVPYRGSINQNIIKLKS